MTWGTAGVGVEIGERGGFLMGYGWCMGQVV